MIAACAAVATLAIATPASAAPNAAIVVDAKTGKVLYTSNADAQRYPASLTKMMTLYMVFEALESRRVTLDTRITFSKHAAGEAPSKLGLGAGKTIRVKDAILALVTKSANDVATAVGEHLGGSEAEFARSMTRRARQLGMASTTFRNAHGLPNKEQVTTARDMAVLGRALREHYPQYYHYFKTPSFTFQGKRYGNHNRLLGKVTGVDGIKTGYTRASGFNLVTSVRSGGREIIAVVLGGDTSAERNARMTSLVEKYLPKASSGARTVAAIPGPFSSGTIQVAAKDFPVPRRRPTAAVPKPTVASLIGANSIFALADVSGPIDLTPPLVEQGDATPDDEPADISDAPPPGWKIQLAATPTQGSAEDLLNQALTSVPTVLANATPYTEPVTNAGGTLYRARFGGFDGKSAARDACTQIKKHKFDCIALQ